MRQLPSVWRSTGGVVALCCLGWVTEFLLFVLSRWLLNLSQGFSLPLLFAWLAVIPSCGITMGIASVHCWPLDKVEEYEFEHLSSLTLWVYWIFHAPILLLLAPLVLPLFFIPIHIRCFVKGQHIGQRWIEEHAIETFLGMRNKWERDE